MNESPDEEANILRTRYGSSLRILVRAITRGSVEEASGIVDATIARAVGDTKVTALPAEELHTWLNTAALHAAMAPLRP